MSGVYLHVDMDAFFASVEQLDNPYYRGKPVVVGGLPGDERSVVSTASYEARAFGVHSAMPVSRAVRLCPQAIFVRPRMERYREKSREIMRILSQYSPTVIQMSIDEALVDLTGMEKLLGPPVKVARKVKSEIFEKTRLTVSVGLASTQYIAKIASGMRKPNGFFVVPRGKEEDFMLSIPLEKLWGAGEKTLAKIRAAGFSSISALNKATLQSLQSNFGKACGKFLYNASHGIEDENMGAEPESHSVSAERTFPADLTDRDAIDSRLLEIAQDVMYRLYDAGQTGRTVCVKIRYGDFSTVSVQSTHDEYVSSTDDLFDRAKRLFWSKMKQEKSVRLIGIGVQNVEDEKKLQGELFDLGSEKKKKLDRVIFEMEKKNPSLKIMKARLLKPSQKSFLFSFFLLFLIIFSNSAKAQSKFVSNDENLELDIRGHWYSSVETGAGISGGYGNGFESTTESPVFTQDVDMSIYFLLNRMWYFEADFADEFDTNTIAAGYIGNGLLKHARIANRGITFPGEYSIHLFQKSIGGGENESPGFLLHFEGEKWKADTVLRYDMMQARSRTFYGDFAEDTQEIAISGYETGYKYELPAEAIRDIDAVFVESDSGSYRAGKRKFRKLNTDEYIISVHEQTITFSDSAKASRTDSGELPAVLVTFRTKKQSEIQNALGNWSDAGTFLGEVQSFFGQNGHSVDIKRYAYDFFTEISSDFALVLQSPAGFSPFAVCSLYDVGATDIVNAAVISESTKTESAVYLAAVIDKEGGDENSLIELYADASSSAASSRFPLADRFPGFYLGFPEDCDLIIQTTSYTETVGYEIGTKAADVSVYINDIADTNARYDRDSGYVTPSVAVGAGDKVRIIWYEETGYSATGAVTGAAGFRYEFFPGLSADISTAGRWSYSPDSSYADASTASPAFAAVSSAVRYQSDSLEIEIAGALSAETDNTTGLYRILGMDENSAETNTLSESAGVSVPAGIEPVLNARPFGSADSSFSLPIALSESKKDTASVDSGTKDSAVSGYAIPIDWNFSAISATADNPAWRAVTIALGSAGTALASAQTFSIALKNENPSAFSADTPVEIFLQLGVNSDADFSAESCEAIPTWLVSKASSDVLRSFSLGESGWQTVTVRLTDEDRAFLGTFTGARLIVASSSTEKNASGKLKAGVFEIAGTSFAVSADGFSTTVREDTPASVSAEWGVSVGAISDSTVSTFNTSANSIAGIKWQKETVVASNNTYITMSRYVDETDISGYKNLAFYVFLTQSLENDDALTFSFVRQTDAGSDEVENAVNCVISGENLSKDSWHKVEVDLKSEKVYVDSDFAGRASVDSSVIASKLIVKLNADGADSGCFFIDELHLSEISPDLSAKSAVTLNYQKDGAIVSLGDAEILHDFFVKTSANTSNGTKKTQASESVAAGIGIWKVDIGGNEAHRSDSNYMFSSVGHFAQTNDAIFGIFDFSEAYQLDNEGKKQKKSNSLAVELPAAHLEGASQTNASALYKTQDAFVSAESDIDRLHIDAEATVYQKITANYACEYGESYADNTKFQFDAGKSDAKKRKTTGSATMFYKFNALKFTPELHAEAADTYTLSSSAKQTDYTQYLLTLPLAIGKQRFSVSYMREGGGNAKVNAGGSYAEDAKYLLTADRAYLYTAIPFNDLVNAKLADTILESSSTSSSTQYYYATYAASWRRAAADSALDLLIPSSINASFARQITASSTKNDMYEPKASISYSANNVLGSYSALRLLKWYNEDEFGAHFSSAVKIPRAAPEDYTFSHSAELTSAFFLSQKDSFKTALEGTVESDDAWSAKCTFSYKRERKTSPLVSFVQMCKPSFDVSSVKVTKIDSLKFTASQKKSTTTTNARYKRAQSVIYTHESDAVFSKYLTVVTVVSPEFSNVSDSLIYAGITVSASVKITF